MQERIQKILSARGICSRRKAEEYLLQGLVKVNGKVAKVGEKADPECDEIIVDGTVLQARQEMLYYVMNKPVGVVTENVDRSSPDRKRRSKEDVDDQSPSVRDLLPPDLRGKIFPVGRLDKETSGLLLFTNDGVLAYRLTHPKFPHEKEYSVRVDRPIPDGPLRKLSSGMMILGSKTKKAVVHRLSTRSFTIALSEGRNRQIRRMCQKIGYHVTHLKRIRIVSLVDDQMKEGEVRMLTVEEKNALIKAIDL